ncbi:MAG: hypothetical protein D8M58_13760 [Calditrichaeota bacterium]|nr:MAG: hypothetical protein DWQ03_15000 [Calditrichota bacterium]MBL1206466.1 hypothetical protein [Calditrichota bacterium]NOG46293.1 hypothetical protein [Calditrichota bacterium]
MKKQTIKFFFLFTLIVLAFGCKKTVISSNDIRNIQGHIENIVAEEGVGVYSYILDDVYTIKNDPNVLPENEVYGNTNPTLLQAVIENRILTLTLNPGQTGSTQITIRNRSGAVFRDDVFTVSISSIAASEAMNRAVNYFQSDDYALAESHFRLVIAKNATASLSDAYMGLGFSRMRLGDEQNEYGYNDLKTSRGLNPSNVDAIAGLSLLEYAIMENYNNAIDYGRETLNKSTDFIFRYDSGIDKNDILLNIALSQYAAKLFDDCLVTIQLLDATYSADPSSENYKTELFEKLQELVDLYK